MTTITFLAGFMVGAIVISVLALAIGYAAYYRDEPPHAVPRFLWPVMVIAFAIVLFAFYSYARAASPAPEVLACPHLVAHVTVHDYDGPLQFDFCVESSGLRITHTAITLAGTLDPGADGVFHSGFDPAIGAHP